MYGKLSFAHYCGTSALSLYTYFNYLCYKYKQENINSFMQQINDPVLGELTYNENEGYWTKKIFLGILWEDDEQLDLMVKCGENEEITDAQRNAYKNYISTLEKTENVIPQLMLSYFKDHYEDIARSRNLDDDLKFDVVDEDTLLDGFDIKALFIDRNGNYGWLVNFIWKNNPLAVILSDDQIKIYEDWDVLTKNYNHVCDKDLGELVFESYGWKKWVKMDIGKEKGTWVMFKFSSYGEPVNDKQREAYLDYKAHEAELYAKFGEKLLAAYKDNYDDWIEEWWQEVPEDCTPENITAEKLMEIIDFSYIHFNRYGEYGWCCECPWEEEHGLAIFLENGNVTVMSQQSDLF